MRGLRDHLRALTSEIDADLDPSASARIPVLACLVASVCLVFMEYTNERRIMRWVYAQEPTLHDPTYAGLIEISLWVSVRLLGFFVLPALAIRLWGGRIVEYGLRARGLTLRPYLGLFALVLPFVVLASRQPAFVDYYPFYRNAGRSAFELVAWELLYAAHFVALEFFFRGFWLSALRPRLGSLAPFVVAVPYCMIHFSKPLLEVLGAIPAGIVLGLLAMQARSIWGGALLHVLVAWTMDALALLQR